METKLLDEINNLCLEVFKIYNKVIRTPLNWREERTRLKANPDSRAAFRYEKVNLTNIKKGLLQVKEDFLKKVRLRRTKDDSIFLVDVVLSSIENALIKIQIIENLNSFTFRPTLKIRRDFYSLTFNYQKLENQFEKVRNNEDIIKIGKELGKQELPAEEAVEIIKKSLNKVKTKIDQVINFPKNIKQDILKAFNAEIDIIDDPSFSMRCVTDPETLLTKILLNKRRKYSRGLLKIAFLHEFCGHALEMAVFDRVLIKKRILPKIFGYAGVSSPNIFDIKAEVFADLMVEPFLTKKETRFVKFRREVWLICRAMADYLYNIKKKTIADVMKVYEAVGLSSFAFEEALMASIFIDGYQGMYLFANEEIEKIGDINDIQFITKLLFMGKIPIQNFSKFSNLRNNFITDKFKKL